MQTNKKYHTLLFLYLATYLYMYLRSFYYKKS